MFLVKMAQLNGIVSDIITELGENFNNLIAEIVNFIATALCAILYYIMVGLGVISNFIQYMFRNFAGLGGVYVNGEYVEGDIVLALFNNATIRQTFISMLILGGVLLLVCVFVGVIRTAYATSEKSKPMVVVKAAFKAIVNFVTVPVVCFLGIFIGNKLLASIDLATSPSDSYTLSSKIFAVAGYSGNRARDYSSDFYKNYIDLKTMIKNDENNPTTNNNFGIFVENSDSGTQGTAAALIDSYFGSGSILPTYAADGDLESYNMVTNAFGTEETWDKATSTFSYYDLNVVVYYYDITQFNYILGIGSMILICYVLFTAMFGLIKRIYMLTILMIISPPIIAVSPLDDGKAFGTWKSSFVSGTLMAYSTVVSLNLFLMITMILDTVNFVAPAGAASLFGTMSINLIIRLFLMLGGALFFKDISSKIASMIGSEDAYAAGNQKAKGAVELGGKVAGTMMLGSKVAKGIGGFVGGIADNGIKNIFSGGKQFRQLNEVGDKSSLSALQGAKTDKDKKDAIKAMNDFDKQKLADAGILKKSKSGDYSLKAKGQENLQKYLTADPFTELKRAGRLQAYNDVKGGVKGIIKAPSNLIKSVASTSLGRDIASSPAGKVYTAVKNAAIGTTKSYENYGLSKKQLEEKDGINARKKMMGETIKGIKGSPSLSSTEKNSIVDNINKNFKNNMFNKQIMQGIYELAAQKDNLKTEVNILSREMARLDPNVNKKEIADINQKINNVKSLIHETEINIAKKMGSKK